MDESPTSLPASFIFAKDFKILYKIGEGGMGVVYAAEQLSTSKPRALKLMHATLTHNVKLRDRFLQEAHAVAQLESDHVAEVVAAGIEERSGAPWIAMELLRGETLDQRVRSSGPLSTRDLFELGAQMRHVLGQAHARGLVHCDLKPENLFISHPRRVGIPFTLKVLDFGIARFARETRTVSSSQVIGSPLWMAPEQWRAPAVIGPSTDVWALALVLFFALTGRVYWRSAASEDLGKVIVEVMSEALAPPSERARELGSTVEVPPEFDAWFLRCLDRDPAQRPGSADAALLEFEQMFDGVVKSLRAVQFRATGPRDSLPGDTPSTLGVTTTLRPSLVSLVPGRNDGSVTIPVRTQAGSQLLWDLAMAPLLDHQQVQRVMTALEPAISEALSVEPVLVGLTEDLRFDRMAARTVPTEHRAYIRAASVLREIVSRLDLSCPRVYARADQREPLRIEPTAPTSCVLSPAITQITPAALVFLCATAAAVCKPELRVRAIASDVAQLRRIVAMATDIARRKPLKRSFEMITGVLQAQVTPGSEAAACVDADGDACTEEAIAAWLTGVDCTLARVGLLASGRMAAAAETFAAPPMMGVFASIDAVLTDIDQWIVSEVYAEAREIWGAPLE